ncbi:MAG: SMC family ATPase [Clostridiales bacterium]|nr:SMC family ATPase [Clostridiales bacterium]
MKPIKLKIKGINSYVNEQVIDFKKLSENGVFGIFGETGSGKTTILDSIILSIYGVSDRDNLQNIINVHTKDAYVEFTFEMDDTSSKPRRYLVRRDFKLRPSGLKTEAYLNDLKSKKTIADMPDAVNNKLLEIVGVGKKEFTKCIALPQNEFDKFLADTPSIRKKTLAKLFDLEQFGIILNEKLKKRKEITRLEKSTLEEKVAVYQGVNKETIIKTEEILNKSDIELKKLTSQISRDKKLAEKIKAELEVKQELLDLEVSLSIKQSELTDINFIEKQIDYTEKYGDFTILNNKHNTYIDELEKLNISIEDTKNFMASYNEELKKLEIIIEHQKEKIADIEKNINDIKVEHEKKKLHEEKLEQLTKERTIVNNKLIDLSSKVVETNTLLKNYKATILDLENTKNKVIKTIEDNDETIDRLGNCQTFKTKQDFALFLTLTKNKINPESLAEVENFNIYDEASTVIHDIENYEIGIRKEIGDIMRELHTLEIDSDNIDTIKEDFIAQNEQLQDKLKELNTKITNAKENYATAKAIIDTNQDKVHECNEELEKIKKQINEEKEIIKSILPNKDYNYLNKTLLDYNNELAELGKKLNELNERKQKSLIDMEITTNNIENYKEKLTQVQIALKPYNKTTFKDRADQSLLLDYEEIPELKEKVEAFHKELNVLESNTAKLREKTKDYIYTKDDYNSLIDTLNENEEKLTELKVFINVNKITIDIQKQNLKTVEVLQEKLDAINKQYDTIEKLENLLANGALIDFVSEEYMGLITDFANSYVYKISKGKYLLNYDGDFNVIDNFNGGIKRSVKTLSGGERFIVSLSLALGISQSIAVNNNKNFNFFFIDEGFGNLSENYIEKVLQSFDALVKLNFTVGFITHVEKMQYYLTSRITVKKESNDEGSNITQYY